MNTHQVAWGGGLVFLIAAIAIAFFFGRASLDHYATFKSPTGDYELQVLARQTLGARFPGQSGDNPGLVILKNARGETLNQASVEMVQLVDDPVWEEDRVFVKLIFEFDLE